MQDKHGVFDGVFSKAVFENLPGPLEAMAISVEETSSFWWAYDIITMNAFAFTVANGLVDEEAYSRLASIFQQPDCRHSKQTYLLETLYSGVSLFRPPASIVVREIFVDPFW